MSSFRGWIVAVPALLLLPLLAAFMHFAFAKAEASTGESMGSPRIERAIAEALEAR